MTCTLSTHEFDAETARTILLAIAEHLPTSGPLQYRLERIGEYDFKLYCVDDPAAWIARQSRIYEESSFLCDGNEDRCVAVSASFLPRGSADPDTPVLRANITFPEEPDFIARIPSLIRTLGAATTADWIDFTPHNAALQICDGIGYPEPWPGFNRPKIPARAPVRPAWVSYWSYAACDILGFQADDEQCTVFALTEELAGRGWFVQLTSEHLDLDRPEHIERLTMLYRTIPELARVAWNKQ